jgi:hypothetical protein
LWKPPYIYLFQAEINQFAPEIAGIFAGHLHSDAFSILTVGEKHEIPMVGVTSISPIFGNNPGFKICIYSTNPLRLESYINYSYPLNGKRMWDMGNRFVVDTSSSG